MSCIPCNAPAILIVNGDPSARNWIEATIRAAGLDARSFDTGADLLQQVQSGAIACAVIDVNLPDGSGFGLQCELVQAGVPTLFLTRERRIASCVKAIKGGAVDFLTIPCEATALVGALRDAMAQAKALYVERMKLHELRSRYETLTRREREVFALLSSGLRNKQIAHRLDISEITVQIHRSRVMRKMVAHSLASLVRTADFLEPYETSRTPATSPRTIRMSANGSNGARGDSG